MEQLQQGSNIDLKQHQEQVAIAIDEDKKTASSQELASQLSSGSTSLAGEVVLQTIAPGLSAFLEITKVTEDIKSNGPSNSKNSKKAKENALFIGDKKSNKASPNKKLSKRAKDVLFEKINITRSSVLSATKGIYVKPNTPKPLNTEMLKKEMARTVAALKNPFKDTARLYKEIESGNNSLAVQYNQTNNIIKQKSPSL